MLCDYAASTRVLRSRDSARGAKRKGEREEAGGHNTTQRRRTPEEIENWKTSVPKVLPPGIFAQIEKARYIVRVSGSVRGADGKRFVRSVGTQSLEEAIRLRAAFLDSRKAQMQEEFSPSKQPSTRFLRTDEERAEWLASVPETLPRGIVALARSCTYSVTVSGKYTYANGKRFTRVVSTKSLAEAIRLRNEFLESRKMHMQKAKAKEEEGEDDEEEVDSTEHPRVRFFRTDEERDEWRASVPKTLPRGINALTTPCTYAVTVSKSRYSSQGTRVATIKSTPCLSKAIRWRNQFLEERKAEMRKDETFSFLRTPSEQQEWLAAVPSTLPRRILVDRNKFTFRVNVAPRSTFKKSNTKRRIKTTTSLKRALRLCAEADAHGASRLDTETVSSEDEADDQGPPTPVESDDEAALDSACCPPSSSGLSDEEFKLETSALRRIQDAVARIQQGLGTPIQNKAVF